MKKGSLTMIGLPTMRTNDQINDDYHTFRGRCKEMSEAAIIEDPTLTLVRGHYFCPIWNSEEAHWWTVRANGSIYDPSVKQFPSAGLGIYIPFNGVLPCSNCGVEMHETDENVSFDSNYAFCSDICHGQFIGIY